MLKGRQLIADSGKDFRVVLLLLNYLLEQEHLFLEFVKIRSTNHEGLRYCMLDLDLRVINTHLAGRNHQLLLTFVKWHIDLEGQLLIKMYINLEGQLLIKMHINLEGQLLLVALPIQFDKYRIVLQWHLLVRVHCRWFLRNANLTWSVHLRSLPHENEYA